MNCGLTSRKATSKTTEEFANGEVCFLLNNLSIYNTVWYQNIGVDSHPVLDSTHQIVYATGKMACPDSTNGLSFNNTGGSFTTTYPNHNFVDNVCTACNKLNVTKPEQSTNGTYLIANYSNLVWFQQYVDAGNTTIKAELTADIVANENLLDDDGTLNITPNFQWIPIGNIDNPYYSGVFDGKGYSISGLYINESLRYTGLFARSGGTIKNLIITDSYINGG